MFFDNGATSPAVSLCHQEKKVEERVADQPVLYVVHPYRGIKTGKIYLKSDPLT